MNEEKKTLAEKETPVKAVTHEEALAITIYFYREQTKRVVEAIKQLQNIKVEGVDEVIRLLKKEEYPSKIREYNG